MAFSLNKPTIGSTDWATEFNDNSTDLEGAIPFKISAKTANYTITAAELYGNYGFTNDAATGSSVTRFTGWLVFTSRRKVSEPSERTTPGITSHPCVP